MRVTPDEHGSEVVSTVRQHPGMTDAELQADGDAVAADLARLDREPGSRVVGCRA